MTRAKRCSKGPTYILWRTPLILGCRISYAVSELQRDVERELLALPEAEREAKRTHFAIFVVHNKLKPKLGTLPADIP